MVVAGFMSGVGQALGALLVSHVPDMDAPDSFLPAQASQPLILRCRQR